ncbi:MAG: gamma-glutamylcyclotransferase family protein [Fibrobacteria bacterium]
MDTLDSGVLLFTYGTLMLTTGIAQVDAATRSAGPALGRGYIHGLLFDLGEYPGAVPLPGPHTPDEDAPKVWGRLIRLRDPAAFFSVIDAYEGFDPARRAASEFVRAEAFIFLETGQRLTCQVYYYNFPTQARLAILGGDYLAHWHAKGRPAQGRIGS